MMSSDAPLDSSVPSSSSQPSHSDASATNPSNAQTAQNAKTVPSPFDTILEGAQEHTQATFSRNTDDSFVMSYNTSEDAPEKSSTTEPSLEEDSSLAEEAILDTLASLGIKPSFFLDQLVQFVSSSISSYSQIGRASCRERV